MRTCSTCKWVSGICCNHPTGVCTHELNENIFYQKWEGKINICKNCNTEMELIIQEIQDTGFAYYCYTCGSVLVTEMKSDWNEEKLMSINWREEEVEWYEVKK